MNCNPLSLTYSANFVIISTLINPYPLAGNLAPLDVISLRAENQKKKNRLQTLSPGPRINSGAATDPAFAGRHLDSCSRLKS